MALGVRTSADEDAASVEKSLVVAGRLLPPLAVRTGSSCPRTGVLRSSSSSLPPPLLLKSARAARQGPDGADLAMR